MSGKDSAALIPVLPLLTDGADSAKLSVLGSNLSRTELLRAFGQNIASHDPAQVPSLVAQVPAEQRREVAQGAAESWSTIDSGAALAWAATLPEAEQAAATEGVASRMASEDEMATSKWIHAMPPGAVRDAATRGLCAPLAKSDPDAAWQWALSIGNAAMRAEVLGSVYHTWSKKGREAAAAALSASSLNAAERKAVQQFKPAK
jgi:hypothetical protein